MNLRKMTLLIALVTASLTTQAMANGRGNEYDRVDTRRLVHAVTADRIISHLRVLQFIANHNDGIRCSQRVSCHVTFNEYQLIVL